MCTKTVTIAAEEVTEVLTCFTDITQSVLGDAGDPGVIYYSIYFFFLFSFSQVIQTKIGLFLLFLKCHFLTIYAGQVIKSTMKR